MPATMARAAGNGVRTAGAATRRGERDAAPAASPPAGGQDTGSAISIRLRSGSRTWIERIGPVAPVRMTGPSTIGQSIAAGGR